MKEFEDICEYLNSVDPIDAAIYMLTMLVPPGKVVSYSTIAKLLGIHPRRVAQSLRRNRIPIVIPCHRVVMKSGALGGYSRGGARVKKLLLRIEGVEIKDDRVPKEYFFCNTLLSMLGGRCGKRGFIDL